MQVDPVELWDLLRLIGLGGAWGAREEDFLRYFAELRRPAAERDQAFLGGHGARRLGDGRAVPRARSRDRKRA